MGRRLLLVVAAIASIAIFVTLLGRWPEDDPLEVERESESSPPPDARALPVEPPPSPAVETPAATPSASPAPARLLGHGDRLRIRVLDPFGAPVPRAWVHVETGKDEDWEEHVVETEEGVAHVPAPRVGDRFHVEVTAPRDAEGVALNLLARRIEGVATDAADVVVALERGRAVSGRILDDEGAPVAGVVVRAAPPLRFSSGGEATTDGDGRFEVRALPLEVIELRVVQHPQWMPAERETLAVGNDHVELVLHRRRSLEITVLEADGAPAAGACLRVLWTWRGDARDERVETDADGRVTIEGLAESVRIAVRTEPTWRPPFPPYPDVRLKDLPFGDGTLTIRLPRSHLLRGRLVDEDGRPVESGQVSVLGTAGDGDGTYGQGSVLDGAFEVGRLAPGRYRVTARCAGYGRSVVEDVPVPGPEVTVAMRKAAALSGRVEHDEPKRLVIQFFVAHDYPGRAEIGPDGTFKFSTVPDEPGSLYVFDPMGDGVALLEDVRPSDGDVEVKLVPGLDFACRVTLGGGQVPQVNGVRLERGPLHLRTRRSAAGSFRATGVPPGTYRARLLLPGSRMEGLGPVEAGRTDYEFDVSRDLK